MAKKRSPRFAVCVDNSGYLASLELHKMYRALSDPAAERDGYLRVVDESGEDYLFEADRFVLVKPTDHASRRLEESFSKGHEATR